MPKRGAIEGGKCNKIAPKGDFVVYVGGEMKRFEVPMSFLKKPIFQQLLDKAAEEYGFHHQHNKLLLPCDESTFLAITAFLSKPS